VSQDQRVGTGADLDSGEKPEAQVYSSGANDGGEGPTHNPSVRPRYRDLDWKAHKAAVKALYIDKDLSLEKTMTIMERDYSFKAS
jgi:hypothetical protein